MGVEHISCGLFFFFFFIIRQGINIGKKEKNVCNKLYESYLIKTNYNTYYRNNYIHTTLTASKNKKTTLLTLLNLQREVNQTGTIQVKLTDNNANPLSKKSILFMVKE